jgi:hypothetical protein
VLFELPKEIKCSNGIVPFKWQYKVYILVEVMLTYKLEAELYCFEEGIKDDFHPISYYWYSYIPPMYNFNSDRSGVYRSDIFGLLFQKNSGKLESIGEIKADIINKHLT